MDAENVVKTTRVGIVAAQIRAGRSLIGMGQSDLAKAAGISVATLRRMENDGFGPGRSTFDVVDSVLTVLESFGVRFVQGGPHEHGKWNPTGWGVIFYDDVSSLPDGPQTVEGKSEPLQQGMRRTAPERRVEPSIKSEPSTRRKASKPTPVKRGPLPHSKQAKVGRNDPCPCGALRADGSPMKYKQCCGR